MKVQTRTKNRSLIRPMTAIPESRGRAVNRRKSNNGGATARGGNGTRRHEAVWPVPHLLNASRTLLVESPMSVYVTGVAVGIGCGSLVLLLLLGVLGV